MPTFATLVTSRKAWIETELKPWCRQAAVKDLRLAEQEWIDIAGKVDPEKTLWYWAWSRFPELVNEELLAIDETQPVQVRLADGRTYTGFPDGRKSQQGGLVLVCRAPGTPPRFVDEGPLSLDDIVAVTHG
ncbi:MAG: hypothetical protein ACKV0T_04470 [Planctomycetales bacterium]